MDYAHQVLAATLAHPTAKRPIPLLFEEICREDGKKKQDCELNAAKRLIPRLVKQHCHLAAMKENYETGILANVSGKMIAKFPPNNFL